MMEVAHVYEFAISICYRNCLSSVYDESWWKPTLNCQKENRAKNERRLLAYQNTAVAH